MVRVAGYPPVTRSCRGVLLKLFRNPDHLLSTSLCQLCPPINLRFQPQAAILYNPGAAALLHGLK